MNNLKPCPFCGNEKIHMITGFSPGDKMIGCPKCGISYETFEDEDVVKKWNTRKEEDE